MSRRYHSAFRGIAPSCAELRELAVASVVFTLAFATLLAAVAAQPAGAQSVWPLFRLRAGSTDEPCANYLSVELAGRERTASVVLRSPDGSPNDACAVLGRGAWLRLSESLDLGHISPSRDPVEDELVVTGADGALIATARKEVLEILREGNACSAWYARLEPNPAGKFATLHFHVDAEGEAVALVDYDNSSRLFYREPYVARAQQNVGPGSTITLNAHGAFFRLNAPMEVRAPINLVHTRSNPGLLHVGPYSGGTLKARVATLLHEFAHVVGLLPVDSGEPLSGEVSTHNTEVVLNHCGRQVEASPNRSIMLPASLASPDRPRKDP